jgi:hypothetical protein
MTGIDNRVIAKIQKLLARGDEDRNDNEHEREIAMRQAHALLAKHGLDMTDVTDAAVVREHLGPVVRGQCGLTTRYLWEASAWNVIAELHGCRIVRSVQDKAVWVIGRQVRCDVVKSTARYVIASIKREAMMGGYNPHRFGVGACNSVHKKVREILAAVAQGQLGDEQVSTGTALIVVEQHKQALIEADQAKGEFFPNLRKGRVRGVRADDSYTAGKAYGASIGLNTQVGSNRSAKHLTHK